MDRFERKLLDAAAGRARKPKPGEVREEDCTTLPSGAKVMLCASGGGYGTSEQRFVRVLSGKPTEEELIARFGGSWGGRVDNLNGEVVTVWAYSE